MPTRSRLRPWLLLLAALHGACVVSADENLWKRDGRTDQPRSGMELGVADAGPDQSGAQSIFFEAESGTLVDPFVIQSDPTASGGRYLLDGGGMGLMDGGSASYSISIIRSATFVLWGRVRVPSDANDSFYVTIDSTKVDFNLAGFPGNVTPFQDWRWMELMSGTVANQVPCEFPLSAGIHTLVLSSREGQSMIDRLLVTDDRALVPH